jgi:hypothetical protein
MRQEDLARSTALIKEIEGWGAMDESATEKQKHQQRLQAFEYAQTIAAPFVGTKGAAALELLRQRFEYPPTWPVIATGQGDTLAHGCTREGQKTVIKYIENCIMIAKNPPPKPPKQESDE